MMRGFLVAAGCILLMASCEEEETPHMPREQMVQLITDLHTAEVYSTMVNDSTHKTVNKNYDSLAFYYKSILNHHNITMEELKENLLWYSKNPAEFDSVYVKVLDEISTLEGLQNATE